MPTTTAPQPTRELMRVHIFRGGDVVGSSGVARHVSAADLAKTAAAYDPAKFSAPLVVGHPADGAPAYGWVKRLHAEGLNLYADLDQVQPAVEEAHRVGAYKERSASFYEPAHPSNPAPGVLSLRHLGLLGAQPPAIKGLEPIAFADAEEGVVSFSEALPAESGVWARLVGALRDAFQLAAHPSYSDAAPAASGAAPATPAGAPAAAAIPPAPEPATPDPATQEAPLTTGTTPAPAAAPSTPTLASADLAAREAAVAERERKAAEAEATAAKAGHTSFCEQLLQAGQLHPKQQALAVDLLGQLAAGSGVVSFAEAGGTPTPIAAVEAFKKFLAAQPKIVDFGEATPPEGESKPPARLGGGYQADPDRADLDAKISSYAEKHGVDYPTAYAAVVKEG